MQDKEPMAPPSEEDFLRGQRDALVASLATLAPGLDRATLESRADAMRRDVAAADHPEAVDEQSRVHIGRSAQTLAMYRAMLEQGVTEATALEALYQAIVEPRRASVKDWLTHRMRVDPDRPEEAFERIVENFQPGAARVFGGYFRHENGTVDDARNFVNIKRCLYNDFYRRHGAPELIKLHCATDMIWAEELNDGPYNARFERPSKMSDGDDMCRFHFHRKTEPAGGMG